MIICTKCKLAVEDAVCPVCGRKKFLREANDDDLVLLTTTDYLTSFLVEEILNDTEIKFLKKGVLGSAITVTVGEFTEKYNFFVLAKDYSNAVSALPSLELSEEDFDENEV